MLEKKNWIYYQCIFNVKIFYKIYYDNNLKDFLPKKKSFLIDKANVVLVNINNNTSSVSTKPTILPSDTYGSYTKIPNINLKINYTILIVYKYFSNNI